MGHHLEHVACRHARRNGKPIADLLRPPGKGRRVGENDEDLAAGLGSAIEQFVAQIVLGGMVELEPEVPLRDFRDGLDAGGANRAENEGDVVVVRGLGEQFAGLGPHQSLQPDGGDAEGGVVSFAEEFGLLVGSRVVADVVGLELDVANVRGVALAIDVRIAAAFKVVEGESRHASFGPVAEVLDGRAIGVEGVFHGMRGSGSAEVNRGGLRSAWRALPSSRCPSARRL